MNDEDQKQQAQVCFHPMNLHLKSIFICPPMVMTGHLKTLRLSVETEPAAFEPELGSRFLPLL